MRRRSRKGRHYGNWVERIDGIDVNLGTTDAGAARIKARELRQRVAEKKVDAAARAERAELNAAADAALGVEPSPATEPRPTSPGDSPPMPAAAPLFHDASSSSSSGASGWAADVNAAADDAADGTDGGAPKPKLDPKWLEVAIAQAAAIAVEIQIRMQEWAWRRYGKLEVARVAPDDPARDAGRELWASFIREKLPTDIPIPDWAAAIAFVAMNTTPVQMAGARRVGTPTTTADGTTVPHGPGVVHEADVVGAAA